MREKEDIERELKRRETRILALEEEKKSQQKSLNHLQEQIANLHRSLPSFSMFQIAEELPGRDEQPSQGGAGGEGEDT